MHKLETTLVSAARTVSGELVIGASTIPGEYLLPQRAAEFNGRYPEVSFQILIKDSGRIIDDISAHKIYLGVVNDVITRDEARDIINEAGGNL